MINLPKFLRVAGSDSDSAANVPYQATMMAYGEGGDNTFKFFGPPHLMEQPGDEIVEAFINYMNGQGLTDTPFRYELNGAVKHGAVLTAMGSLILKGRAFPFIAMISPGA
jgi:hypothetical protein